MIKKIVSFFSIFAIILSLTCPAFAYDSSMVNASQADIWAMALERYSDSSSGYASMLLSGLGGIVGGGDVVCPISPDNLHHGNVKEFQSPHFSGRSYPVVCICDYCGLDFYSSVSSSQLSDAYHNCVSGLPGSGSLQFSDDGSLYYTVNTSDFTRFSSSIYLNIQASATYFTSSDLIGHIEKSVGNYFATCDWLFSGSSGSFSAYHSDSIYTIAGWSGTIGGDFSAPISGTYVPYKGGSFSLGYDAQFRNNSRQVSVSVGDDVPFSDSFNFGGTVWFNTFAFDWFAPVFKITPSQTVSTPDTSTRVAPFTQTINNYNGTNSGSKYFIVPLTYLDSLADLNLGLAPSFCYSPGVYDEETKIFTEPVTGAQYQTTGWIYDYNTRTYDLSLAAGTFLIDGSDIDRIQLTYGDDELTIAYISQGFMVEKDVYAYVIARDTSTCQHTFTSSILQESTCTALGQRQYTCSKCGYTYTEEIPLTEHTYISEVIKEASCIDPGERKNTCSVCGSEHVEAIPALGHDWLPTEATPTTYELPPGISCPDCAGVDITAELSRGSGTYSVTCNTCEKEWVEQAVITYGQTTYTCSRCGETYVESEDEHSGLFEAIGDFIADGIIWITDKLQQLIESISGINDIFFDFAENIKEKAGNYPAFLGAVIAILPEDFTTVLWFGIIAAVVLTVWKKWFR